MGLIKKAALIGGGIWAVKKLSQHDHQNHREVDVNDQQAPYYNQQPYQNSGNYQDNNWSEASPPYSQQGANASYYSQAQWPTSEKK